MNKRFETRVEGSPNAPREIYLFPECLKSAPLPSLSETPPGRLESAQAKTARRTQNRPHYTAAPEGGRTPIVARRRLNTRGCAQPRTDQRFAPRKFSTALPPQTCCGREQPR